LISKSIIERLKEAPYEGVAFSLLDFSKNQFDYWEKSDSPHFFDLASLTKPLTMGYLFQNTNLLNDSRFELLMNHRGGFKAHKILEEGWKEELLSLEVKESETLYSDLGVLRLKLELDQKGLDYLSPLSDFYQQRCVFWKEARGPFYPFSPRGQGPNDENIFFMNEFSFHAGLYAQITGLSELLLGWNHRYNLLESMRAALSVDQNRFVNSWDRVQDSQKTLAGEGASLMTFGFLGYVGSSLWIDAQKQLGYILLTNAAYSSNHQEGLNNLRREIGKLVWKT
jgi:hypothetical protein